MQLYMVNVVYGVCIVAIDLLYIGYDDDDEHDNHSSFLPIQ